MYGLQKQTFREQRVIMLQGSERAIKVISAQVTVPLQAVRSQISGNMISRQIRGHRKQISPVVRVLKIPVFLSAASGIWARVMFHRAMLISGNTIRLTIHGHLLQISEA